MEDMSRLFEELLQREAEEKRAENSGKQKLPVIFTALKGGLDDDDFEEAKLLIDRMDVNITDPKGRTVLHIASKKPNTCRIIKYLLSKGLDPMQPNSAGKPAVFTAIRRNAPAVCLALLQHCDPAALRSFCYKDSLTFDHLAAMTGDVVTLRALIKDYGFPVDNADNKGWTPLLLSAKSGAISCLMFLLENGSNVNHAKSDGNTALHLACMNGQIAAMDALLQFGANIAAKNKEGQSPYDVAKDDKVKLLLRQWVYSGVAGPTQQSFASTMSVEVMES